MEIMNLEELTIYLKCSKSLIRKLVRENRIPFFRIGNRLHFNKILINEWIDKQSSNIY